MKGLAQMKNRLSGSDTQVHNTRSLFLTKYLLPERAEGVEAGAASSSARRGSAAFPAAAAALSGAALGWRPAARAVGGGAR